MKLKAFTEISYSQWDEFVKNSRNGTFMQERRFLNYHAPGRFLDHSLMIYDPHDKLTAVIPAALKNEGQKRIFSSHPGASHGGIIINQKIDTNQALTLVKRLIENCRASRFDSIEIKMVPRIYQSWPSDEVDFALRYHGFFLSGTELATALPLKEIDPGLHYMAKSVIRNIRKAEKMSVTVKETNDYAAYWNILNTNLKTRHNALPTHTLSEILDLTQRYPQAIKLFAAYYQEEMIGGVLVFLLNNRVMNCFYIAHNEIYQHMRPLNLLFYTLISWGIAKGYHYLDWGISTEDKGKHVNHSLFQFKENFGGRGVLRETYRLNL